MKKELTPSKANSKFSLINFQTIPDPHIHLILTYSHKGIKMYFEPIVQSQRLSSYFCSIIANKVWSVIRLGYLALIMQQVKEKEKFEFKPILICFIIDVASYPFRSERFWKIQTLGVSRLQSYDWLV